MNIQQSRTYDHLSLLTARDLQMSLASAVRERRRIHGLSRRALALDSTVPPPTIKRFETTGEISLRQFLLLWQCVDRLDRLAALCDPPQAVLKSIDDVLAVDRSTP